jgi:hypothetical protein
MGALSARNPQLFGNRCEKKIENNDFVQYRAPAGCDILFS